MAYFKRYKSVPKKGTTPLFFGKLVIPSSKLNCYASAEGIGFGKFNPHPTKSEKENGSQQSLFYIRSQRKLHI